jgi:UDP-N-acetylmuramate dehydrogenase
VLSRLKSIAGLHVSEHVPLAQYTRFGIGGPARFVVDASTEEALAAAIGILRAFAIPCIVIGGGTNLVASDAGYLGAIVRYTDSSIDVDPPSGRVRVAAGAMLQDLVDRTIGQGLAGLETLTGIPGWVGGAIYGNAGAYGHSIHERIQAVSFFDGQGVKVLDRAACEFRYRDSIFKRNKDWVIVSAELQLAPGVAADLIEIADGIRKIRDEKYPPTMRCAGSIFKNLIFAELAESARALVPERVVREGKVPSAYFLEQVNAKGMVQGGMKVADYHANLIFNQGDGTARELRQLIEGLKKRVRERFGVELEEEVQYI